MNTNYIPGEDFDLVFGV